MQRLLVLTAHPQLYTPRRLREEAAVRGIHFGTYQPPSWWEPAHTSTPPELLPSGNETLLLARPGTFSLLAILRAHRRLTRRGFTPLQRRSALLDACDQWRCLERLGQAGIPTPASRLLRAPAALEEALAALPGSIRYVKARRGSKGSHVMLAPSCQAAGRWVRFLWGEGMSAIVQEDLRSRGPVVRHLVIGERVVASAEARAAPGEFRTNWHQGGKFHARHEPGDRASALAVQAVRVLGLPYAGVDTIGRDDPAVLEVNASPGLQGLERCTARNLAGALLEALLEMPLEVPLEVPAGGKSASASAPQARHANAS